MSSARRSQVAPHLFFLMKALLELLQPMTRKTVQIPFWRGRMSFQVQDKSHPRSSHLPGFHNELSEANVQFILLDCRLFSLRDRK